MLINYGLWPNSFTVNGQTHKFIVISPQFVDWPSSWDIDGIINYCVQNYKVNVNRIYLTGLSMGGGVTWNYASENSTFANRLAAIVPICGASWPDMTRSRIMAGANLPVWATHNDQDPIAPLFYTVDYVNQINMAPSPTPLAKKTIFVSGSHDAWSTTYSLSFRENGMNVYEWMLQYHSPKPTTNIKGRC
jgi:predicted peptidase